ncbi:hypothetical protein D0B32_05015 [Paraburkholderia sp. DHOC27]|nr:hypothetical protein D0B32_05015 [Paraburkholderia sp. DHOC27]
MFDQPVAFARDVDRIANRHEDRDGATRQKNLENRFDGAASLRDETAKRHDNGGARRSPGSSLAIEADDGNYAIPHRPAQLDQGIASGLASALLRARRMRLGRMKKKAGVVTRPAMLGLLFKF